MGQSETAVCDMTDMFLLLVPPAAGDELQVCVALVWEYIDIISTMLMLRLFLLNIVFHRV